MAQKLDRELPELPEGVCRHLFKDKAQYRTAREIWLCTKDERFSEVSRKKAQKCLEGKWCDR
ncbi:MAG: hypothetical protein AAB281_03355 [Actinomycetota bacterium]